ncbi:DUF3465 domain-containing protein [Kingella oralis]|uniref:DUF3465 domain-containing protein n=1 Tax=Kingella oralis TaxID=505 RepID=UPI002D7EF117|nr:DUF3465 domain-containing protein [Kingella oralis]
MFKNKHKSKYQWVVLVLIVLLAVGKQWLAHRQSQQPNAPQVSTTQSQPQPSRDTQRQPEKAAPPAAHFEQALQQAYQNRQSNLQIQGSGRVIKTLPDDTQGSRHQRFIVKLASGQTLLFAHNIDLAPKIRGLKKGDTIVFNGEYEWSEQGGVIHWTHKDPNGRHADGWLEHNGQRYE